MVSSSWKNVRDNVGGDDSSKKKALRGVHGGMLVSMSPSALRTSCSMNTLSQTRPSVRESLFTEEGSFSQERPPFASSCVLWQTGEKELFAVSFFPLFHVPPLTW
ncbi:hypothetical protein CDAR_495191 [Caerostris darwini]|uniref:Uncharacterized protein n=1 Tax=Caerostris darwini TaxID=1538125 RepID=A0AAV4UXP0_9ARAC|nr:hypothetical protein CDAR_495191 [Caerostris darwini]